MLLRALGAVAFLSACCPIAHAADWTYSWTPATGDVAPTVDVTPLKYGKTFAYAVEIDDCPASTRSVVLPLLSAHHFTDAPPGVVGGNPLPFVGGVAVMMQRLGGNETYLSVDDLKHLQSVGWGLINHSYWHAGRTYGTPPEILSEEQIKTDLFWSQSILASHAPDGRAPSHFVYPNGYTAYNTQLQSFGLYSGSRVGGSNRATVDNADLKLMDLNRAYLDEGAWQAHGKGEPMHGFPDEPAPGQFLIDFTHNIDSDESSDNHKRWTQRLATIEQRFGQPGKDSVWCAPTGDVVDYTLARRAAIVQSRAGEIRVTLPDDVPGAPLTLKIEGVGEAVELKSPAGGVVYRSGTTVWLTTPLIGLRASTAPTPKVVCAYEGDAVNVKFPTPVQIAAVRILQAGEVPDTYAFKLDAVNADGTTTSLLTPDTPAPGKAWGVWKLYDVVPNRPAVRASGVNLAPDPAFKQMQVWVVP